MHRNPITFGLNESRERLTNAARTEGIRHFPLVDGDGHVVAIRTLRELLQQTGREEPVLILAGGEGRRLRPLTEDCPKPMIEVAGRPILERIIDDLTNSGFRRFFISVNYQADKIVSYFGDGSAKNIEIEYLRETKPLGTAGSLSLLPELDDLPVLVVNGDVVTHLDYTTLVDSHRASGSAATMSIRTFEIQVPFGVIESEGEVLKRLLEKPTYSVQVNAGIYVVAAKTIELIQPDERIDMPGLFDRAMQSGLSVQVFPLFEYWADVGRHEDLARVRLEMEDHGT
jgi:NDP-sugar pyrophosphorylase family protein